MGMGNDFVPDYRVIETNDTNDELEYEEEENINDGLLL
jgi:hypothetical protein